MRGQTPSHPLFTGWRGVLVASVFAVLFGHAALQLVTFGNHFGLIGEPGIAYTGLGPLASPDAAGWSQVLEVDAEGSATRAGIVPRDQLRLADPLIRTSDAGPGTRVAMEVRHAGKVRAVELTIERIKTPENTTLWSEVFGIVVSGICALVLALFVFVRGWGQRPALLLATGLLAFADQQRIPAWTLHHWWTPGIVAFGILTQAISISALFALVPVLYAEHVGRPRRLTILAIAAIVLADVLVNSALQWTTAYVLPTPGWLEPASGALTVASLIVIGIWCLRGIRDADAAERNRFLVLLLGFVAVGVAQLMQTILSSWLPDSSTIRHAFELVIFLLNNGVFLLILAYAVLRHRVVDIGFALNRTMVYGTVSVLLLGSFGLIEWGIEHLLPEEWVKASAWFDAGAAVLVYLAFHRVHDAVEHRVERLFFHAWQANEGALREFVALAPHFEDAGALARAFAEELERFGGGAKVALYRRSEGALDRVAGNWAEAPRHFREDDRAFAALRATRRPLDLSDQPSSLPGALALPIIDHGALAGLVLMGEKAGGALYRPDEIALLGWATHEVGLAMAALHVGLVESELRLTKAQLARLTGLIGDRLASAG